MLIAEGANRQSPGAKRQRYREALGECGEVASTCSVCESAALGSATARAELIELAERTAAMLVRLIESQSKRIKR